MEVQGCHKVFDFAFGITVSITFRVEYIEDACNVEASQKNLVRHMIMCVQELLHNHFVVVSVHFTQLLGCFFLGDSMLFHVAVEPISNLSSAHLGLQTSFIHEDYMNRKKKHKKKTKRSQ